MINLEEQIINSYEFIGLAVLSLEPNPDGSFVLETISGDGITKRRVEVYFLMRDPIKL